METNLLRQTLQDAEDRLVRRVIYDATHENESGSHRRDIAYIWRRGMAPQPQQETLLTSQEVMAYLRISRPTLYRLIGSGKLIRHKVGGALRFYLRDVQAVIEEAKAR